MILGQVLAFMWMPQRRNGRKTTECIPTLLKRYNWYFVTNHSELGYRYIKVLKITHCHNKSAISFIIIQL